MEKLELQIKAEVNDAGDSNETKTSQLKAAVQSGINEHSEVQESSVETIMTNSGNKDRMSNEVILPNENKAKVSLENEIVAGAATVQDYSGEVFAKAKNKNVLPSSHRAEIQLANYVQEPTIQTKRMSLKSFHRNAPEKLARKRMKSQLKLTSSTISNINMTAAIKSAFLPLLQHRSKFLLLLK